MEPRSCDALASRTRDASSIVGGDRMNNKYQFLSPLSPEEYSALEKDCLARGIFVPVELDEEGNVLDGHHRVGIAKKHGLKYDTIIRKFKSENEKEVHVLMLHMARRHVKPHVWGAMFKRLLELRGVKRGS